mgnify:CR=1 FL=1|jgi:hypothetical protein
MSNDKLKNVFRIIGEKPIAFHATFSRMLGGVGEAIFFQQIMYWSDKGCKGDGIIYKTDSEMEAETTLTPRMQRLIRRKLKEMGILKIWREKVKGAPVNHYKIDGGILRKVMMELHPSLNSSIVSENTSENIPFLSKEKNGTPVPGKGNATKVRKIYINNTTNRITQYFADKCLKYLRVSPVFSVRDHRRVSFAMNTGKLTEEEIKELFNDWFNLDVPDDQLISISAALSGRQIEKFKVRNAIYK